MECSYCEEPIEVGEEYVEINVENECATVHEDCCEDWWEDFKHDHELHRQNEED